MGLWRKIYGAKSGDKCTAPNNRLRLFQNGVRREILWAKRVVINVLKPIQG
jgi:hypothetical protein